MDMAQGKGLASALGNTPMYHRQKYMPLKYVYLRINRGYENRNIYVLSESQD
jgi:hypothetical protein